MPAAPLPADEARRLAALYRCTILDAGDEECFEDLTRVAAAICEAPIALVTLIDADRVWVKGAAGLDVGETPRQLSFCHHTIQQDDVMVVPDAALDPRFRDNPFVTARRGVAFYAGASLCDADGNRLGTVCVVDDSPRAGLTSEQAEGLRALARLAVHLLQVREVATRFATISESSSDCTYRFRLRPTPELDYVSPALQALTGYLPDDLYGNPSSIVKLVHPDDLPMLELLLRGQFPSETVDVRLVHRDGRVVWTEHHVRTVHAADGSAAAAYGIARETTQRHETEAALRAARGVAERANAAKDALLSRVSHELRTPLNAVLGFAQLLEMDLEGEQAAAVEQISTAGRHLLRIVDQVLSLSAPEQGALRLLPVSLEAIARDAVAILGPEARARGVVIGLAAGSVPAVALADERGLTEAVHHLVANAVKFNVEAGQVRLECGRAGDQVWLSISDTGSGLDENALERLFTPFERLDAEARGIPGTGLGLALAKSAVESMGGSLTLASRPGEGSVFTVSLLGADECPPPARPAAAVQIPQQPGSPEQDLFRVVYVEDNESNRTLVQRVLDRRGGVALALAFDGTSGVALIRETRPDLVLLDLHLPGLDGAQVLEALRNDPATADLPVVVLTADAMPDTVARLRAQGIAGLLTKPLDIRELLRLVDEHAGQAVRA